MSITRADMLVLREECLKNAAARDSWENDAEAIKIAVLIANNNGFTTYKSLSTNYEELRFNLIFSYLTCFFVDSSINFELEEETGKRSIVIDWSDDVRDVVRDVVRDDVRDDVKLIVDELNVEVIG